MGYSTDFTGQFNLDKTLTPEHKAYLAQFSNTRRMKRNAKIAASLPDPIRLNAKLPIGTEGGYFVGAGGFAGQDKDNSVSEYNRSPSGQPGLWCQWAPTEDGTGMCWNNAEKFYDYVEWIQYLIRHFLAPWGYVLHGDVTWRGEDDSDIGKIMVRNNVVTTKTGRWVYGDEPEERE